VLSLPQEYRKRWSSPIKVAALSMSRQLYGNLHIKWNPGDISIQHYPYSPPNSRIARISTKAS
jgi:hypothetical protein